MPYSQQPTAEHCPQHSQSIPNFLLLLLLLHVALQSHANLRGLSERQPVSSDFWPLFPVFNFAFISTVERRLSELTGTSDSSDNRT